MNLLEIIVLAVLAICAYMGYRKGFLRVVYSLVAGLLVLGIVAWLGPIVADGLENTKLKSVIEEKCLTHLEEAASRELESQAEDGTADWQEALQGANIVLPEKIIERFVGTAAGSANELLEEAGVYQQVAEGLTEFIIEGIAFFLTMVASAILMQAIGRMLDIVSRLPVIRGVNRTCGIAAGLFKGVCIVWLAFYVIALCAASDVGKQLLAYIQDSQMLLYLYEHNALLWLILWKS